VVSLIGEDVADAGVGPEGPQTHRRHTEPGRSTLTILLVGFPERGTPVVQAFSQLKRVLDERGMSVPDLRRRLQQQGLSVNLKSLYRLVQDDQPLERLNLRVAGMICQVCEVPLSRLIAFELTETQLRRLSTAKQQRLDALMAANNQGHLTPAERQELQSLVREAEEIAFRNARKLANARRELPATQGSEPKH
jgi:hypothetical protein